MGKFGLSFSLKRAVGLSAAKGRLSRQIGIPLTRSGRQRKFGRAAGCLVMIAACGSVLSGVTLTACGGGSSPSSPPVPLPTPTPTPAAYSCANPAPFCTEGCGGKDEPACAPPTAWCKDGEWSCSQTRAGTCSTHKGVSCWVCPGPLC